MKKRRIKLPVFAVIFALVLTFAGAMSVAVAQSSGKPSDCFTWKAKINGSTFYLAGSTHTARKENYPLPKAYMKCYQKADKVIMELKEDFNLIEQKIFQYAEKDRLKEDQYLDLHLSAASLEKLKQIIDSDRLNQYVQYESWLLNMMIAGKKSKLVGYDPLLAIDKYFNELAQKDNKEIIGLDSLRTQLLLFEYEVPFDIQVKIIENAVSKMEIEAKKEVPLFKAYFDNNIGEFEKIFLQLYDFNIPQIKQAYDIVFTNRNKKWVEQFEKISVENPGTYFVLVGSGHYFGPNNIRELLEKKGYTVEKI
jgi:uncharacterized protein YbaP (TraB family)